MGEEQRLSPVEQLATARAAFEAGTDFTVAVEEEFALLDPETLGLTNRFEELKAAAAGSDLEPHLVGELIALPTADREALRAAARNAVVTRWSWAGVAARLLAPVA